MTNLPYADAAGGCAAGRKRGHTHSSSERFQMQLLAWRRQAGRQASVHLGDRQCVTQQSGEGEARQRMDDYWSAEREREREREKSVYVCKCVSVSPCVCVCVCV